MIYGSQTSTGEVFGIAMMVIGLVGICSCAWTHLTQYLNSRPRLTAVFLVFSLCILPALATPSLIMHLHQQYHGWSSYAVVGLMGAVLSCACWWIAGVIPKSVGLSGAQSSERVTLLNSINDFISKKDELELRDTFDFPSVVRDAILAAKIQLTTAAATQAERDMVARDMVDGQNVVYVRYVHMDGNNITPLQGKSGILHLTPKAVKAKKQLAIFYSSALTPIDVSDALKDLERAVVDNQEILMDTINESYAANPLTISNALSCPKKDCMTVNNLFYSRFIQLQPKATAITSAMRKYIESHQF